MMPSADDITNPKFNSETNAPKRKAPRNQILTAPLPDLIAKNIEAITLLHTQEVRDIPTHQRLLERRSSRRY